jgi:glycosidase
MPITPIGKVRRKGTLGSYYASADFTAINPEFGTLNDFKELVDEAHRLGMKVILDWVANHTAWDHVWRTTHRHFYVAKADPDEGGGDWTDVIKLNYHNKALWAAMIAAMQFWVEQADIDGFRLDVAFLIPLDFWREARSQLEKKKPLFWFGELDFWDHADYLRAVDAGYAWQWMHATQKFYRRKGVTLAKLREILDHYLELTDGKCGQAWFLTNHDENSYNGTEYQKYGKMVAPLAVFSATWEGIPLLYSGQELPNKRRLKFFDRDPIEWGEAVQLHTFYQTLLSLRAAHRPLFEARSNTQWIDSSAPNHVLAYRRSIDGLEIIVILNFSNQKLPNVRLKNDIAAGTYQDIFKDADMVLTTQTNLSLEPWGYHVYLRSTF